MLAGLPCRMFLRAVPLSLQQQANLSSHGHPVLWPSGTAYDSLHQAARCSKSPVLVVTETACLQLVFGPKCNDVALH